MNEVKDENILPQCVREVKLGDRIIYLVGTAHVSKQSVADVKKTIEIVKPDSICVELCEARYKTLKNPDHWKNTDIFKVIKEGKSFFLLAQLIMSSFYKKIGEKLDVTPGAEMMEGIRLSEETGTNLVLADRDVQVTLKRLWGNLSFWRKMMLMSQILSGMFVTEEVDKDMIENMKEVDQLEAIIEEFAQNMPSVKATLIDERDIYLAQKIKNAKGNKVVAVVGAGHLAGIIKQINEDYSLDELEKLPGPGWFSESLKWFIPLMIVLLIVAGFFHGGKEVSINSIYIWCGVTGGLSAIGTILAFGHPITIIAGFIAAPFTTLHPLIGVGMVTGLVQAWINKPTVKDFERLSIDVLSFKGFWQNPVSRVLLVYVLSGIGASIGTFVAGSWIFTKVF